MTTMEKFIEKLNKMNFSKMESSDAVTSAEGWEVSWKTSMLESGILLTVRLTYDGGLVTLYGCESVKDIELFCSWFVLICQHIVSLKHKENDVNSKVGKLLYEAM